VGRSKEVVTLTLGIDLQPHRQVVREEDLLHPPAEDGAAQLVGHASHGQRIKKHGRGQLPIEIQIPDEGIQIVATVDADPAQREEVIARVGRTLLGEHPTPKVR
jgi:hypothetical protein